VIAPGLAVPHARMAEISNLLIAIGTSLSGIDFKAAGMPPVNVVIMILSPKDNPGIHLQVMAALAKEFSDPESVRKLAALETPADVVRAFAERSEELPGYLRACDVMNASPVTLLENDTLGTAIETFAVRNVLDIPLLDPDGDIRGTVSLEDILKLSLPEHLLWMNDLSPILHFQPFAEMLRSENETKLADFMREDVETVEADVPAIQLAKIFLMKRVRQIIVTRDGKFIGAVSLQGFSTKLFWA
jgi:CBS domain-containing protein